MHGRTPQKPCHKRVHRLAIEFLIRAHLLDLPLAHDGNAMPHSDRFILVVCDKNRGQTETVHKPFDLPTSLEPQGRIEVGERFIEEQDPRTVAEAARQGYALFLTTRETTRETPQELVEANAHNARGFLHLDIDVRTGPAAQAEVEGDIATHPKMGV